MNLGTGYWRQFWGIGLEMRKGIGFHGIDMQLGMELEVKRPMSNLVVANQR